MFLRSLAIVLALAGPALATNVTRVWTSSGANVNHLTCAANDSLDASLCPSVPWQVATSAPSCSQEGLAYWHSTNDRLGVCDGSSFVEFYSGAHTTDTGPSPDCSGSLTYQDGEGNCDPYTLSGNTTELTTVSGTKTNGDCVEFDSSGNIVAAGAACGTGSVAFSAITGATNTGAAMLVGTGASLAPDGSGTVTANDTACPASAYLTGDGVCNLESLYPRLLGRSGGQELNGGNGSGEDLTLESTDHSTKGTISILDGADFGANFDGDTLSSTGTLYSFLDGIDIDASGFASNHYVMRVAPIIHLGQASIYAQTWQVLRSEMYFDMDDATGSHTLGVSPWLFANQNEYHRSVDTTFPHFGQTFRDQPTFSNDHASAWSINSHITSISAPVLKTTVNGNPTLTASVGYQVNPAFQCNNASATCTITTQRDFYSTTSTVGGSSSGTEAITTKYSFVAEADAQATTHYGIWNEARTVNKPVAQTLTAASNQINHSATVMSLSANGNYTMTSNPVLTDGADGEVVTLVNVDATPNTIALPDGNGLRLAGTITLNAGDTITLMYNSTVGDWLEVSRGDNS